MVGAHAALAIVAALEHRDHTGEGRLVEVALLEVATAVTADQVIRYSIDGTLFDRRGTGGVYRVAGDDEWVSIDLESDPMPAEPRAAWCESRTAADAVAELQAAGIPAAAMVKAYATLDDPQLRARGFFEPLEHPVVGSHEYPTWPMRMSAGPAHYWSGPAPMLGQHTDEVLRGELGVTDDELARLRTEHVIGTTPYFG
jgi:crotonobetainyl-CoA:carnitine CoA-transferase CaiB-like acyl-CoA transferase